MIGINNSNTSVLSQYQNEISGYQSMAQDEANNASLYEDQYQANPNLIAPRIAYDSTMAGREIDIAIPSFLQSGTDEFQKASFQNVNWVKMEVPSGLSNLHVNTDTWLLSSLSKKTGTENDVVLSVGDNISSQVSQTIQQQVDEALGRTDVDWKSITNKDLGTYDLPNDPAKQAAIFKQAASTLQTILDIINKNLSSSNMKSGHLDISV